MKLCLSLIAILLVPVLALAEARPVRSDTEVGLENAAARIVFDKETGQLLSLWNAQRKDEYLKDRRDDGGPFTIYSNFHTGFDIASQGTVFRASSDPAAIAGSVIAPPASRLISASHRRAGAGLALHLTYRDAGNRWETEVEIWLPDQDGASEWDLRITNLQPQPETFMAAFPDIGGLRLGTGENNLQTTLREGGGIMPAWTKAGGIYGNGGQMSMQWHALFDRPAGVSFGLITADPEVRNKWFRIVKPRIAVIYFPPETLNSGQSWKAPRTKILIGSSDWKPVARAYRDWFAGAFRMASRPAWGDRIDSWMGAWFAKKGGVLPPGGCGGLTQCLDDFSQLPSAYLKYPADLHEYAFHTQGSSRDSQVHTDGDNILREDLGGAPALKEGIARIHGLGYRFAFYVEGYIVHKNSELAKSGKAERWSVMHRDGSITGSYTKGGFYQMCPGAVEWQDHLAEVASRLVRDTGADAVRLDSLGFYFLSCYNPAHRHESPFGYNRWIQQLLDKVSRAVRAVNPDCVLTTEAPVDFYSPWFHGALHLNTVMGREIPLIRVALPGYRPYLYQQIGPIYGSLAGLPGGSNGYGMVPELQPLDENWRAIRHGVADTLTYGEVGDADPEASLPDVTCRLFHGVAHSLVVCARVEGTEGWSFPKEIRLAREHKPFTVRVSGLRKPVAAAYLYDIETTRIGPADIRQEGRNAVLSSGGTNWFMALLREADGPSVAALGPVSPMRAGESRPVAVQLLTPSVRGLQATLSARGLNFTGTNARSIRIDVPGTVTVVAPRDAAPGRYQIELEGPNLIGMKRFVEVLP
jgi:hypothetical protein